MISINYLTLERLVCWTSVKWETIKTTYFWQTCIGPESNVKNICFHHKKLFGKSFEEPNNKCCNVFNTHKSRTVSHSPIHKNKHWIYCLKTIKSEEFQDHPPPFWVDVINGWPLNSSWLWRANIWNNNHIHLFNILSNFLWKNGKS